MFFLFARRRINSKEEDSTNYMIKIPGIIIRQDLSLHRPSLNFLDFIGNREFVYGQQSSTKYVWDAYLGLMKAFNLVLL